MGILNFGSCNIDMVYSVSHITKPGETISANSFATYPGGKGLNQSVALARAGTTVFHAGCIGSDGVFLRGLLTEAGADTRYLKTVSDRTGHAIIQVDSSGENCIIIYHGANAQVSKAQIDSVLSHFQAGDYLLTQNEISELPYLIAQAAAKGLHVVLNPSPMEESLKSLDLDQVRYLVLNETEADGLLGTQDPAKIQQLLQECYPNLTVVLTLGRSGSVYISPKKVFHQSAFSVPNVDTTAAGDTFTGYFIAAISAGEEAEKAMRMASAASALAVSQNGAASSIPDRNAVEEALKHLTPYALNL